MAPKESERDDTRSFLGEHGSTRILTYFLDEMSTRLKAVFARARRALLGMYYRALEGRRCREKESGSG